MDENLNNDNNELILNKKGQKSLIFGLVKDYSNPSHIPYKDKISLCPI